MRRRDTGIVVDIETFITNVKRLSRWYQSLDRGGVEVQYRVGLGFSMALSLIVMFMGEGISSM
jgi:hypothetical protein